MTPATTIAETTEAARRMVRCWHRGLSIDCPKCNLGRHLTPVATSQDSPEYAEKGGNQC